MNSEISSIYSSVPAIFGDPHFTAVPEQTSLEYPVFGYGIVGKGENTIVELVEALFKYKKFPVS